MNFSVTIQTLQQLIIVCMYNFIAVLSKIRLIQSVCLNWGGGGWQGGGGLGGAGKRKEWSILNYIFII